MRTTLHRSSNGRWERGATAVEFAIVAMLFFTIVLGIMEFGRVLYVWNTVQEVTRRAAREAVVRGFADAGMVSRAAVFNPETGSGTAYLPAGLEISDANVKINYLNGSLAVASPMPTDPADNLSACNDVSRATSCIRFVEACVATGGNCTGSVNYVPMAGLFPFLAIPIPLSSVIMPAESLGFSVSP
ncbi:pilus assembly protein [Aromatoleum toluolicum]|uniref:Pilus assembly protein n=1 Tax=Aromatoleum toluolicum TaxID=90060 RepID=A0ABX1NKZ4_9RHOO|nr:TadE family protein [Aromatoleum toluolicum]NMG00002.1 pilus assembly protein [Aromatoleum toluolicum]